MAQVVLEQELQANLKVPRIGRGFLGHLSERARCWSKAETARLSNLRPVGMIDEVVGICGELKPCSLVDRELLLEIEIPVLVARPVDAVADTLLQIESTCGWLGEDGRAIWVCCGEVFVGTLPGIPRKLLQDLRSSVHHPELALGAATEAADFADASVFVAGSDAARRPVWNCELPLSCQPPISFPVSVFWLRKNGSE